MTMKESYSNHHGPCIAPYECWFMESQDFVNCCRMCNFKAFNSRFRAFLSDLGLRDSRRVEVLASLALQGEECQTLRGAVPIKADAWAC